MKTHLSLFMLATGKLNYVGSFIDMNDLMAVIHDDIEYKVSGIANGVLLFGEIKDSQLRIDERFDGCN